MPDVNTRNVTDLVTAACKMIGLYTVDRTLPSSILQDGIDTLNEQIDSFEVDSILIPYNKTIQFTSTVGKASYYISKDAGADVNSDTPVKVQYVQLLYNGLRQPVQEIQDNIYFESWFVDTQQGRPYSWFMQRGNSGSTLTLFPVPAYPYEIIMKGKFALRDFYNGDTFTDLTPSAYLFLKYVVARSLANNYPINDAGGSTWNEKKEMEYQRLYSAFKSRDDKDLSVKTNNVMTSRRQLPYLIWSQP